MVILDTSVVIDHLRQPPEDSKLIDFSEKHPKETLGLSMISIQELYEGKSTLDEDKERSLLATLASFKILPYNYEIAKLAGEIARDSKNTTGLADAAIAATALINESNLYTLNKKHFINIPRLSLAS